MYVADTEQKYWIHETRYQAFPFVLLFQISSSLFNKVNKHLFIHPSEISFPMSE